jgi:hypothetical protein
VESWWMAASDRAHVVFSRGLCWLAVRGIVAYYRDPAAMKGCKPIDLTLVDKSFRVGTKWDATARGRTYQSPSITSARHAAKCLWRRADASRASGDGYGITAARCNEGGGAGGDDIT